MKVLIANPAAAGGRVGREWDTMIPEVVRALGGDVRPMRTNGKGDGANQAQAAIAGGARVLYSLGGDGTHGEVTAGIVASGVAGLTLGVIHAGTGGDFRRMLPQGPADQRPVGAARAIAGLPARPIDVGRVVCTNSDGTRTEPRIFLNEVSFGMGGLVCQFANATSKRLGGKATFLIATGRAMARYTPATVRIVVDGRDLGSHEITNVGVSNGQFAGGGMHFAPRARLDDGLFDVTIIRAASMFRAAAAMPSLYDGTIASSPLVVMDRGAHVAVTPLSEHPAWVEADGEPLGIAPLEVEVLPHALALIGAPAPS